MNLLYLILEFILGIYMVPIYNGNKRLFYSNGTVMVFYIIGHVI
jgi:hypothetical protein